MKIIKIIAFFLAGLAALVLILLLSMIRPDIPAEKLMDRYTDETSLFLEIDGMQVHVKDEGNGPVLLLLHGMFASLHTWDSWVEALKDQYRVVRVDLPGFGITGPHPQGNYSLRASMYLLESIREELDIEEWTLIGNSMGGGLALSYAQLYPDHTDKVVLFNGGRLLTNSEPSRDESDENESVSDSDNNEASRPSVVLRVLDSPTLRNLMGVLTPKFIIEASLKEVYGDPDRLQPETVTRYYELLRREGNRQAYLNRREMQPRRDGNLPDLPEPVNINDSEVHVLIIWGRLDSWIPVNVGYRLHEDISNSELIIYDDLGHVPMEEDPARTIADVREFLSRDD